MANGLPSPKPEVRLVELLDTILDGSYSEAVRAEFSDLVDNNPQLTPLLVSQLRTHGMLHWNFAPSAMAPGCERADLGPLSPSADEESEPVAVAPGDTGGRSFWGRYGNGLKIAAALAAALLVAATLTAPVWREGKSSIGHVVSAESVVFTKASVAVDGESVSAGRLEIESGRFALEFGNGVEFEVSGPAACEIVSGKLVRLLRGQATADVPRWARGFTIETPDVEVIDLGTRFGVATREDGKTDVVVFEGEVDLKSLRNTKRPFERRLVQGEAARIDHHGEIERIFQVHGDSVGNQWSTFDRPEEGGVITAVWDNLTSTKSVSYYQVLAGGLDEDAPAYVDHPHEWNGSTLRGLAESLRGADYVRTINGYRYRGELAIHVEIARDATLFVFFDNRTPVPDWLNEHFVNTGLEIGLDEDAWYGNPTFTLDVGAGQSIDNYFTVWSRPVSAGDVMTLGSMGVGREARAMYGVAAVPR